MRIARPRSERRPEETAASARRRWSPWLVALIALLVIGAALVIWRTQTSTSTATTTQTATLTRGNLDVSVTGNGSVQPANSIDLTFQSGGQVRNVLVKPGDHVKADQPLAKIDDSELTLQVSQATANLSSAQARLAQARNGTATPQDLAQAQASLRSAQAQLQKTRNGNATADDLSSAEANLRSAQARLDALLHPSPDKISAAQAKDTQAQSNLAKVRATDALAKERANQDLQQAANALRTMQDQLSSSFWSTHNPDGSFKRSTTDPKYQTDVDSYNTALRAEQDAESRMQQAQLAYDAAIQQERIDIQQAQVQADDAHQQLMALLNPSTSDITQAQASVDQAQAQHNKLRHGGSQADITQAQASVDQSRAALERLTAPSDESTITIAQASVDQAQAQLDAAMLNLKRATLTAPFAGTISAVNISPGSTVGTNSAAITLIDRSSLHINLSLSESDVARIQIGQPAQISLDALAGVPITGTVTSIAPAATIQQNVVTYLVQVQFDPGTTPVRIGMSASAGIIVQHVDQALLVPNRAIQRQGTTATVQVLYGDRQLPVSVPIATGATSGSQTEIIGCVETGTMCLNVGDRVLIPTTTRAGQTNNGQVPLRVPGFGGNRG